jgi:hypothetical protein
MQARRFQGGFHLAPSSCTCTALTTTPWTLTQAEMMIVRTESSHAREAQKFNQSRFIIIHIQLYKYSEFSLFHDMGAYLRFCYWLSGFLLCTLMSLLRTLIWSDAFSLEDDWNLNFFHYLKKLRFYCLDSRFFTVHNTPSFSIYKVRHDMALSSKLDFDHLFLFIYYIFYGYKHIIIRKYIWWQIQPY